MRIFFTFYWYSFHLCVSFCVCRRLEARQRGWGEEAAKFRVYQRRETEIPRTRLPSVKICKRLYHTYVHVEIRRKLPAASIVHSNARVMCAYRHNTISYIHVLCYTKYVYTAHTVVGCQVSITHD